MSKPRAGAVSDAAEHDAGHAADTPRIPLVVDVDGTLLRCDLFREGLLQIALRPTLWHGLAAALLRGKAAAKAYVATNTAIDVTDLPSTPQVEALIGEARARDQPVVLATGCHEHHARAVSERFGIPVFVSCDGIRNPTGQEKARLLSEQFGAFDYVGNGWADLPVWRAARTAYAVNLPAGCARYLSRSALPHRLLDPSDHGILPLLRAVRPHQWAKNLLLFVPALAAHLPWGVSLWMSLLVGFTAFSATASAIYLLNDLLDLPHDRRHARKRNRPLASGQLSVGVALGTAFLLAVYAAVASVWLSPVFAGVLLAYASSSLVYSLDLKRRLLVDVITLALLYTLRVVAGAALADVALSRWFIAFSIFVFFALAVVKRVIELRSSPMGADGRLSGRAYEAGDVVPLIGLGTAATAVSCLVYVLYISSEQAQHLYRRPDLLWVGLPLLLYWQARIWIFAVRGSLHDDPIAFAVRDRVSYITLGGMLLAVILAS